MKSSFVNPGKLTGKFLVGVLTILIYGFLTSASALERDRNVAQFYHTAWTAKEGAPSQISSLAQTADGYLWIGSARGLFRFDGVQFEAYEPPAGVDLPSHNIYALMATPDGGLWISFRPSGLGFLKDGVLEIHTQPEEIPNSWVYCFARDFDNRIWAGTHAGLALRDGSHWIEIGADWNFKPERVRTMLVDRDGTLWVATDSAIVFLPRGSKTFQSTNTRVGTVSRMSQAPDGRIWMAELETAARPVPVGQDSAAEESQVSADANDVLFDRDGSLWITCSDGVKRVRFPERLGKETLASDDSRVEIFRASDGLTDDPVHNLFEDREGNIWLSSIKGLDRFRYSSFVPVKLPPGHQYSTLLAGAGGDVWAASAINKSLMLMRGEAVSKLDIPTQVASVYQEPDGDAWWGGHGGIWRQGKISSEFYPQPNNTMPDFLWEVVSSDNDGGLWVGLGDVGLMHFKDGVWSDRRLPNGLLERTPSASYRDSLGRIWFGYTENRVALLDGERVRSFSSADGIDIGRIRVIRGRGAELWLGGELGLAFFDGAYFRTIKTADGEPFGTISGIIATSDGALWLNELRGIVRISPDEVRAAAENSVHAVSYRRFDFLDGLPGGGQMNYTVSTAIQATDGRLWFSTDDGLAWIDPAHLSTNALPPPISIRSLNADAKTYRPTERIDLPQGTQSLEIDYTALCLSMPERVHFRYRLEGAADEEWQDVGNRREAFYNNLRPGDYRFRVIASNNDGVWNETGATLMFTIAPAFYQTIWFSLLCLALAGFTVWLVYQWRLYFVKSRLHLQFEERLTERTRIAQELHDSLLQGVVSASMQLNVAADNLPEDSSAKPEVNRIVRLMEQVTREGRNTLRGLRSPAGETSVNIEQVFADLPSEIALLGLIDFRVKASDGPKVLRPVVRDETYWIGREAVLNACRHSDCKQIEIVVEYDAKFFRLVVRDDGRGIKQEILDAGREGHWGLVGMRERAKKIGARLKIRNLGGAGTEIELIVPSRIAFDESIHARRFNWLPKLSGFKTKQSSKKQEQEEK